MGIQCNLLKGSAYSKRVWFSAISLLLGNALIGKKHNPDEILFLNKQIKFKT